MSTIPRMVRQITVRPPTAPPTIGPIFVGSCLEEAGIESDVEDVNEEFTKVLELDAGTEDVSTTVAVGRESGVVRELLIIEIELSSVVVAATAFGTGKSLSVRASAPQAMYSKD